MDCLHVPVPLGSDAKGEIIVRFQSYGYTALCRHVYVKGQKPFDVAEGYIPRQLHSSHLGMAGMQL